MEQNNTLLVFHFGLVFFNKVQDGFFMFITYSHIKSNNLEKAESNSYPRVAL